MSYMFYTVAMDMMRGRKKLTRRAQVPAHTKQGAIERAMIAYPPRSKGGKYFNHRCDNTSV